MYYQQGKCLHGCLHMVGAAKKLCNLAFLSFQKTRKFLRQFASDKCDGDYQHNITSLVNNMQLYLKSLQICYKKRLKIFFLKFPKEQNNFSKTPQSNSVFQIPTQSFQHNVFHNHLKDNIKENSILTNIADCHQNRNSSQNFLWG